MIKNRGDIVCKRLLDIYGSPTTALRYRSIFQLLIAVILSAQSTDRQVNQVTDKLFKKYPDARQLAEADIEDIEKIIYSTGFYRVKARNIKKASELIIQRFNGEVPDSMEKLLELPGVGRKTANIVLILGFSRVEGIPVDTHVYRLARRIGLSAAKTPQQVEKDLMSSVSGAYWRDMSFLLITHGRSVCKARKPQCDSCILADLCNYKKERVC